MVKGMYNITRKLYFFALTIGDATGQNGEKDCSLFNMNSGSPNMSVMDTNWCSADNTVPAHITMKIQRLGFSAIGVGGVPLTPATLFNLSRAVVTMKIGDREIKNGTLAEFFKMPGAASNALASDFHTGPSFMELLEEQANPKDILDFQIHIPANIGQQVRLVALMDTQNSAKQG